MKSVVALSVLLGAATVFAAPSPPAPTNKPIKFGGSRRINLKDVQGPAEEHLSPTKTGIKADNSQNDIWSGGVLTALSGDVLTSVAATFTVPTPSVPDGGAADSYSGAAWVGIDGTEGDAAGLWQAGATWGIDSTQDPPAVSYGVWYEWVPNALIGIENFPVNAGDVITVNLTSQSPTTGTVVIADETTGQTTTISTSAPNPTATLIGNTVEWITEDLSSGGPLPFANYGSVAYTGCSHGSNFGTGDATGSTLVDLAQNGVVLSSASQPSGGEIDTTYQ